MRTCPAPGFGISRSTISKSPPALEICAAFIGAIPTLVVAMKSSYQSQASFKSAYWQVKRVKITHCELLGHPQTDFQSHNSPVIVKVSANGHQPAEDQPAEADNSCHSVERPQILARDSL